MHVCCQLTGQFTQGTKMVNMMDIFDINILSPHSTLVILKACREKGYECLFMSLNNYIRTENLVTDI